MIDCEGVAAYNGIGSGDGHAGGDCRGGGIRAMSQAAVSQHVGLLEAELGSALFTRGHRGVVLTPTGEALRLAVEDGLRSLQSGVTAARRLGKKRTLQILTDFGFAAWWLMPRIARLSGVAPDVELRLITTQSDNLADDPEFDLAILFGAGAWPGTAPSACSRKRSIRCAHRPISASAPCRRRRKSRACACCI